MRKKLTENLNSEDEDVSNIDNKVLNFNNSEAFLKKQKHSLLEKNKQMKSSIEHYENFAKEIKSRRLELNELVINEALEALRYPWEIKQKGSNIFEIMQVLKIYKFSLMEEDLNAVYPVFVADFMIQVK